jgi:hypothetical protein
MIARNFRLFYLLVLPLWASVISAQLPVRVDGEHIKDIVSILAADSLAGRATGTRGCEMAEEYVANAFKKLGLATAGENNTYFHHYTIANEDFEVQPSLVIDGRTFYYGYNEDFSEVYNSARGEASAEVVFAGYGIVNPERGRNDFDSLDIRGKIVLIRRGAPRNDIAGWRPSCIDSVKAAYCHAQGAAGVLFYDPLSRSNPQRLMPNYSNRLASVDILPGLPVFSVDERVARYLLANTGQFYYRVNYLLDNQTISCHTGRICTMKALPNRESMINARNVLAMIPGTDRNLKNEYVMIGGHLDHIGVDDAGNIRNGADDNASGVAVTLGIAEAMVKNKYRPKRSIIFAAWTGEEMGLLGSKAWCENPTIDLRQVVVYFNLDMVGLGNGTLNMPGTEFAPEVYEFIKKQSDSTALEKINWSKGGPGGSDHNYFLYQGVPAFAGMTAGSHPDYHQPGDDADKINVEILQLTGDFIYHSTEKIAGASGSFLSAQRMEENKFRLVNYCIFNPVPSLRYRTDLDNKNFRLGFVDFSDVVTTIDPKDNFLALLGAMDQAITAKKPADRFFLAPTAFEAMNYRSGILAAFNPDLIRGEEIMFKALARFGFHLAVIDRQSAALGDTASWKRMVKLAAANGVGFILKDLPAGRLDTALMLAEKPCLVLSSDPLTIPETLLTIIREKEHVLVYMPNGSDAGEAFSVFLGLQGKVGKDRISVTPAGFDDAGFGNFKGFMKEFTAAFPDRDDQYQILFGNFQQVAALSLQSAP